MSSDEDFGDDWVFYSDRPDWKDLTPVEQDDGPHPVVQIAYSEKFSDVYNYFRAIVCKGEKSERALELTENALRLNAANYTVWQYRRDILKELKADLAEELVYIEDVILGNPKNYQVWHHRRVIVELLNDASQELELTAKVLAMDAKNYHAWQHRQWAIAAFDLFDDELNYVDQLIGEDMRNNSAWNQRFFVLQHTGLTPEVVAREAHYVMNRIRLIKNNESTWNFLRGLLEFDDGTLDQLPEVGNFCEELYGENNRSPYLLAFLIDLHMERALSAETDIYDVDTKEYSRKRAMELCEAMITEHDKIRRRYWEYVRDKFRTDFETANFELITTVSASN